MKNNKERKNPDPDILELLESLHPLERRVLPALKELGERASVKELADKAGMLDVEVMRAIQWLSNKGLVKIKEDVKEYASLGDNGVSYRERGLPEYRFLDALGGQEEDSSRIAKKLGLTPEEFNVSIGLLKRKGLIDIRKDDKKLLVKKLKQAGERKEEEFLRKDFPVLTSTLTGEEEQVLQSLKRRKGMVRVVMERVYYAVLTPLGRRVAESPFNGQIMDNLTPHTLKVGAWKGKKFRKYDVVSRVPPIYGGRRHFVNEVIRYVKQIWLELGFEEMTGRHVQTSFWTFDALFTPQDHPSREMQDTFFVEEPSKGRLPDEALVKRVKETHERGGITKSMGWNYKWSPEMAVKNVLRTHTTVLSARTLASLDAEKDLPGKFFSIGRVYRNETMDFSHLFEFNQVEGIVVSDKANFRNLLFYLRQFFTKMGYDKVRIRPAYFPYTEPSVEVDVYDRKHGKWLELAGAGIFRPEVTAPLLGRETPVLAWGMGLARIIMLYYGFDDVRELYRNELSKLRNSRVWLQCLQ